MKNPILIFLGFPGAGKTTLAKFLIKKHPEFQLIRIFDDYMKDKHIGSKGEELTKNYVIKAHDELYKDLLKRDKPAIVELGTSYPRYNCKKVKKLIKTNLFEITIIFCLLDKKLCLERFYQGYKKHREIPMLKTHQEQKMKRHFPKIYQIHCRNLEIPSVNLDMKKPVEKNVKELEKII